MDGAIERCIGEVALLAGRLLPTAADDSALAGMMDAVQEAVEAALRAARPADPQRPACAPGCAACCTVNVATLPVEGAVAAAWLRARLEEGTRHERARALLHFHDRVRWLEDEDRIAARERCPLLDPEGRCAIHPVRPLACRSLSSLDAGDCRRALRERMERDGGGEVRMDLLQNALYCGALAELQAALGRRGLDARCRDVSGMTGIFLAEPGLVSRFLAGERLPIE